MAARPASAFSPRVVLGMLLFGALAFIAMLYFIGVGEPEEGANDGGAHAAAKGLNGYAALANLLEDEGYDVSMSRNRGKLDEADLLIITPPHFADVEELTQIINNRRFTGPTIVVLPKWLARKIPPGAEVEAEKGWVVLGGAGAPYWLEGLEDDFEMSPLLGKLTGSGPAWSGLGRSGSLPDREQVMALEADGFHPVIRDAEGRMLAGYLDDENYYPRLDEAAGRQRRQELTIEQAADEAAAFADGDYAEENDDYEAAKYNVMFVAEPDLFNNYGMADRGRADLALELISLAMEGEEFPVNFDLTFNGLGQQKNLLTIAFTPPFLAATLCLILAMIVVAWRAFRRFGPPVAEERAIAFGKSRLVANSAAFIQRTGRIHLLAAPYAALVAQRVAKLLGLRRADPQEIDEALHRRVPDAPSFTEHSNALRSARSKHDTLRAARALKDIERTLTR